jgi:hypothetical protein
VEDTEHFVLEADGKEGIVRVRRTTHPFRTISELEAAFDKLVATIASVDRRSSGLLMDLRSGPMRNDPIFESALERQRKKITSGFRRVALLVETPLGLVQGERHARADGIPYFVTMNEQAAVQHLTG